MRTDPRSARKWNWYMGGTVVRRRCGPLRATLRADPQRPRAVSHPDCDRRLRTRQDDPGPPDPPVTGCHRVAGLLACRLNSPPVRNFTESRQRAGGYDPSVPRPPPPAGVGRRYGHMAQRHTTPVTRRSSGAPVTARAGGPPPRRTRAGSSRPSSSRSRSRPAHGDRRRGACGWTGRRRWRRSPGRRPGPRRGGSSR